MSGELRSKVWWLLGRLFVERPDEAFLDELRGLFPARDEGVSDDERLLIGCLHAEDESLGTRLRAEHTRLFRGISEGLGPPPPYESLYRGDRLMDPHAEAVRRDYAAAGFAALVPATALPDHLGTELQFLSLLALRESEAWDAQRPDLARSLVSRQIAFLDQHLLAWLPEYAQRITKEAREPFYRAAVSLTERFALDVRSELGEMEAELDAA